MRSLVNSCLGGREGTGQFTIDPKWDEDPSPIRPIQNRDIILLSSDGLHSHLSDRQMQELATKTADNPQQFLHTLVQHALDTGGRDNLTGLTIYRKPNSSPNTAETP
jgi:serine/threonine protein phosphatase PrpC